MFFHKGYTSLYSHQKCTRVPFFPYLCQPLLSFIFVTVSILKDVRWYLIVGLLCIVLMISNVEYIFTYPMATDGHLIFDKATKNT